MSKEFEYTYAVILAGGYGTRFWPKSRQAKPKQLCTLGDNEKTLLEQTLDRVEGVIPPERRIIITNQEQVALTRAVVGDRCRWIIPEACSRNTAPAIALAALLIKNISPQGEKSVMISLHADHAIADNQAFLAALRLGVTLAAQEQLVLLGCTPNSPATGFGYIKRGKALPYPGAFQVAHFEEKPERARAQAFLDSGEYYWNSGIFVWQIDTLLGEFAQFQPRLLQELRAELNADWLRDPGNLTAGLTAAYGKIAAVSIDEGIIESSKKVVVIEGNFGWNDIGSWSALRSYFSQDSGGNVALGDVLLLDCKNTTVESSHTFVAALGVENLVIVATKDAILICPQDRSQEVKRIVMELEKRERRELL